MHDYTSASITVHAFFTKYLLVILTELLHQLCYKTRKISELLKENTHFNVQNYVSIGSRLTANATLIPWLYCQLLNVNIF